MPRKNTKKEEIVTTPEAAPVEPVKAPRARKAAAPKTAKPKVSAATHKAAPRKRAVAVPAVEPVALIPFEEEVRAVAYGYFVERGYTPGDATADWFRAEAEVRARRESR
ncbi:MAG: DUF2934 domain-containing protein [Bryobacter sp.]|jgi:hypothetical protein|nr:DUF2934 domain-containing protein [Bryobacter sp.]